MRARISIYGSDLLCVTGALGQRSEVRLPLDQLTLSSLNHWKGQYQKAVRHYDPAGLLALGMEIFGWIDQGGWATGWLQGTGERQLEISVDSPASAAAAALLDLPWEVLARSNEFLDGDSSQRYVVFRSIARSPDATPAVSAHRDLSLMFMAASPVGQVELSYEEEESSILKATARLPVQLTVEESGCAEFLKDSLAQGGPFDVLHISCHGDLGSDGVPVLAWETPQGDLAFTRPADVAAVLGELKAPLVFLSACRTAEAGGQATAGITEPFVRALIRSGVANVLGWDGSVFDSDAIDFAQRFYSEVANHASVAYAAATARQALLNTHLADPRRGQHWHLARVYAGPMGAGPLCERSRPRRRLRRDGGFKEFLDKANRRVPVATAQQFVGRRREVQQILKIFRDGDPKGVLIYGMGNLGKSSLAARLANRLPGHKSVVVFKRYDPLAVFEQLLAALPGQKRLTMDQAWRVTIEADGATLANALEDMLNGQFDSEPILLIIDDLEQILESPSPNKPTIGVKEAPGNPALWRVSLAAVLRAFDAADSASRLLITSRYRFSLLDHRGEDLADTLAVVQLLPIHAKGRAKQWRAAQRLAGRADAASIPEVEALVSRAMGVASGNPGLQEILCRPLLAGELEAARQAIEAVAEWKTSGSFSAEENAAQEFFQRVSFEVYGKALTPPQRAQLRAAMLFSEGMPIPRPSLLAVGEALQVEDPASCLERLVNLGLVDNWGAMDSVPLAAANALARSLAGPPFSKEELERLATAANPGLAEAWRNSTGAFPADQRAVEAARLMLIGDAHVEWLAGAAEAAWSYLFDSQQDAMQALEILQPAIQGIEAKGWSVSPQLLLMASQCAERIGDGPLQIELLKKGLALQSTDPVAKGQLLATYAETQSRRGQPEQALQYLQEARALFQQAGDVISMAVTMSLIADILQQRGDSDEEALRIRREEELPVFERLGDVGSRAITMGKIADILQRRGDSEEALRIRREEELPVFERLGDVRSRAITMGKIADILQQRGDSDEEALRIRREEELPVFERLGDVGSRAITMGKIADILQQRGDNEEALRIHREEQLPVFERLGDVRSRAMTMGKIADVLQRRCDSDEEALRIRCEEELPVYERLGDMRSRTITIGKIADILQRRGDSDEALRIRREEELPAYERLGDVRSQAMTMGKIADVLQQRGDSDEALRIRREEELPVYERLGDVRGHLMTMGKIADILQQRGDSEEALRIFNEVLPAAERIQDMDMIAKILFKRASVRLNWSGYENQEDKERIVEDLKRSFELNCQLRRVDGIAFAGSLFGQLLVKGGLVNEAITVLEKAATAFEGLQQPDQAAKIREQVDQLQIGGQ
jgi:phosphopentomutase